MDSRREKSVSLDNRLKLYEAYLLMKVQERDWHGVADAAMDIRELEAQRRLLEKPT
jgi:hypothetical protein